MFLNTKPYAAAKPIKLTHLKLLNFRCFREKKWGFEGKHIFISGENGVGKTALIEALSLFAPGRGLRQAKLSELQSYDFKTQAWCVNLDLTSAYGHGFQLATAFEQRLDLEKRILKSNQTLIKQNELQEIVNFVWLTPQLERQFHHSNTARRKFIDRLIAQYEPTHMGRIARFEKLMSQRRFLLQQQNYDALWVEVLEHDLSKTAISIIATRLEFVEKLQHYCIDLASDFPKIQLTLKGEIESHFINKSALEVETLMIECLKNARDITQDITPMGAHKVEVDLIFKTTNTPYRLCSTGEQKAIFVRLILGHIDLLKHENQIQPVVLLDDIGAHLDNKRLEQLIVELDHASSQIFYTGTVFPDLKIEDMQKIRL